MKDKLRKIVNTRQFHICMVFFIVFTILLVAGFISIRYSVEGENNLPFTLSKISVISSVEGVDVEDIINKWNFKVNQNNDVYLYIKKNDHYKDTEIIENIRLDNFVVNRYSKIGDLKLLKPDSNVENVIFRNITENEVNNIEFKGDMDSNIKELKISNQGGLVVFRYAINNVGNYISNDGEEIVHNDFLKKLNINNDDLKFKVSFDMYVNLNSGKSYKSVISLDFPVDDVVDGGIKSREYTDLKDIVFKRM